MSKVYLAHHGILGQKWGKRNGPPYPLGGGDYSKAQKRAVYNQRKKHPNSIYNKRHFDDVLRADKDTMATLSYDKNRLDGADMFYAAYKPLDKHQYNSLFNRPIPQPIYDENGTQIKTQNCYKWRINTTSSKDLKIASQDSSAQIFRQLYTKDRDFYNFVTDESRMQSYFVKDKYKFKGYRESRQTLDKMRQDKAYVPNEDDLQKVYRMFNYVIPFDGAGNARSGRDMLIQRNKFFEACKKAGYGAILDTNDAIYGGFKATAPIIVFDMQNVVLKNVEKTTLAQHEFSNLMLAGRKLLGI